MRRFVTPIDINGTGRVQTWGGGNHDYGPDNFGRVQFNSYFRPAGSAGQINIAENATAPYGAIAPRRVRRLRVLEHLRHADALDLGRDLHARRDQ